MAEHERAKEPLPTRPPRPHPQGLMQSLKLAAVAVTAAALALTACGPAEGSAGTVVAKESVYKSSTKTRWYFLTTRDADGVEHEFRVSKGGYDSCYRGSAYPTCLNR